MESKSIHIPQCAGKVVAVLGLGKTGQAAVSALKASGAEIWAWDDMAEKRNALGSTDARLIDLAHIDWTKIAFLVLSPGIAHTFPKPHPAVQAAKKAGVTILSDIELLYRSCPRACYVAITGTNGKSTVTSLIGHILKHAGKKVQVGGNLGPAVLGLAPLDEEGIYVLELSSYQLEITPSAFADIAIILNISPDHIERHGDFKGYVAAKKRILRKKGDGSTAIIGLDDEETRAIFTEEKILANRNLIGISAEGAIENGIGIEKGVLVDALHAVRIDLTAIPSLLGKHNWQNATAAYAACLALGLQPADIEAGLKSYPGLAHRQELIARLGGISFVNDSKATNADAAARALACYDEIYWIAGGRAKEGGLAGLEDYYPRIRKVYLIGEAEEAFAQQIGSQLPVARCGTLDRAFAQSYRDAEQSGSGTILLSPACASWDQFANFEARGEYFRSLVDALVNPSQKRGLA